MSGIQRSLAKGVLLLGAVFFLNGLIRLVEPFALGNSAFQARWQHYRSVAHDVNAVFVGSSRTMRHFDVAQIDSLVRACSHADFSSYNLGSSGINLYRNAYVTRKLIRLKEDRPRYLFLEIAHSMNVRKVNVGSSGASFYVDFETLTNVFRGAQQVDGSGANPELKRKYIRQWLYRLFHAAYGRASAIWDYKYATSRGFTSTQWHLNQPRVLGKREAQMVRRDSVEQALKQVNSTPYHEIDTASLPRVDAFVEIHMALEREARQRGVQIIHVHNIRASADPVASAVYHKLPGNNKIALHRHDLMPFMRTVEAWWDPTHLGAEGAYMISEFLANEVCERDLLAIRSD